MQIQPEAMRSSISGTAKENFLYQKDEYAKSREEIVHFQLGNCSNVAPFRYYSVRSLGFLLYAVCQLQQRAYCRFSDNTFSHMLELFRNVGEDDRERLERVDLYHMGIVPDGLSFVTATERHQINENQVQMFMSMNKQLMGESSSTYMPEVDSGTEKERTLGEARIQLQTSVSLSNALLNQAYNRAVFSFAETCRRLCIGGTRNPLAKEFQERCQVAGVPKEVLDVRMWDIEPERVLGGGNKAIEMLQADRLMAARGAYDPDAQRKILHIYTEANVDDPQLAEELVPLEQQPMSTGTQMATMAMGTLMESLPVETPRTMNEVDYVGTLLMLAAQVVQQLEGMQQVPGTTPLRMGKVAGLANVLQHAGEHLQVVASDPTAKDTVKALNEKLMEVQGALEAQAQQLDEEMKQQQPEQQSEELAKLQAKLEAIKVEAEARAQIKMADAEQKQAHRDAQWANEERRRDATTAAEMQRKNARTMVELQGQMARVQADIAATDMQTAAEIRRPKPSSGRSDK